MSPISVVLAFFKWCLAPVIWLQRHLYHPIAEWWVETVLGTWKANKYSMIREAQVTRLLSGRSAWVVSLFDSSYYLSLKRSWKQQQAWQAWWHEERPSTFNAVIEHVDGPMLAITGALLSTTSTYCSRQTSPEQHDSKRFDHSQLPPAGAAATNHDAGRAVQPRLSSGLAARSCGSLQRLASSGGSSLQVGEASGEPGGSPLLLAASSATTSASDAPENAGGAGTWAAEARQQPYRLRAVAHSLGGASLLMHVVLCCKQGRGHRLSRLILLTPAGFHMRIPSVRCPLLPPALPPLLLGCTCVAVARAVWQCCGGRSHFEAVHSSIGVAAFLR